MLWCQAGAFPPSVTRSDLSGRTCRAVDAATCAPRHSRAAQRHRAVENIRRHSPDSGSFGGRIPPLNALSKDQSPSSRAAPLPFRAFGESAAFGLEAHVYCPGCEHWGQIDASDPLWADRPFAGARLRRTRQRFDGAPCRSLGYPSLRLVGQTELVTGRQYVDAQCGHCVPLGKGRRPSSATSLAKRRPAEHRRWRIPPLQSAE